jgi:hypothetical protein
MDLSQLELTAPGPIVEAITDESLASTTVVTYGRAKGLARLPLSRELRHLWISGVNNATVSVLGSLTRLQSLTIHDFRVADLNALTRLQTLAELAVAGSPKLKSLAGVERLPRLRSLVLFDNCNYHDIDRLRGLADLETLCLEGGMSKQLVLPSLEPIGHLVKLRRLRLASVRIADRSLQPLHGLTSLREVFIAKAFPSVEFRALASAIPNVRGEFVDSFRNAG